MPCNNSKGDIFHIHSYIYFQVRSCAFSTLRIENETCFNGQLVYTFELQDYLWPQSFELTWIVDSLSFWLNIQIELCPDCWRLIGIHQTNSWTGHSIILCVCVYTRTCLLSSSEYSVLALICFRFSWDLSWVGTIWFLQQVPWSLSHCKYSRDYGNCGVTSSMCVIYTCTKTSLTHKITTEAMLGTSLDPLIHTNR